jgi:diadenosine tetraphosphatase ApaH/serine/threonine PP2A family protein phosphatase
MRQLAIFGDIHANLPALKAVLADMRSRELDERYCLGDLVGYGTWPNAVVETVHSSGIPTLIGNYDEGVGNDSADCGCAYKTPEDKARGEQSIAWSNAHTSADNKAFLRGLPFQIPLEINGISVLLVHGSPRKINEYLYIDRPDMSLERIMDQCGADVLVCGHTHLTYDRTLPSGRRVINAGSVGKPKDGDVRACYLLMSATVDGIEVEFIRVPYDVEKAARAIEGTALPDAFADMLREARG